MPVTEWLNIGSEFGQRPKVRNTQNLHVGLKQINSVLQA